jgi:hypothetical protein
VSSFRFRQLSGSRGRTALFVALTLGAAVAAAFVVPAVASGRIHPFTTIPGPVLIPDNVDTYALQATVGGQNNATAVEGFVTNGSATFDNAVFGYTVASSGNAIIGIAQPASGTATALVGESYSGYGVIGATPYTGAAVSGVLGQDLSGTTSNSGTMGTTSAGYGVTGTANGTFGWGGNFEATGPSGYGVYATSSQSDAGYFGSSTLDGIYSYTFNDSNTSAYNAYGVEGVDANGDSAGTGNSGVYGYSNYGTAVTGQAGANAGTAVAGSGIVGITNNDSSPTFTVKFGVEGVDNDPNGGSFDAGTYGSSVNGYGQEAFSTNYIGTYSLSSAYVGGEFATDSTGAPALLADAPNDNASNEPVFEAAANGVQVFSIAGDGTTVAAGSITQFGSPLIATRTLGGSAEIAYGSRETRPTIEDVGEANLVAGSAYVPIDHTFGATIDPNVNYLVFVTPQGDTQGLYVTGKTRAGFYVREHGGSSDIAFDYRIVAKPAFENGARLPDIRTMPALARFMMRSAPMKAESPATIVAQDRRMRAGLATRTFSATKVAKEGATIKFNLARVAKLHKQKFPHIPTPAELHVPATTPH